MSFTINKQYLASAAGIVAFWPFSFVAIEALFGTAILPYRSPLAGDIALFVTGMIAVILIANLCIGVVRQTNLKWLFGMGAILLIAYSIAGALLHLLMFACFTDGSCV